jgi:hypothetical protein
MRRGWGWGAALSLVASALTACAATAPLPEYQARETPAGIRLHALPSHSSQVVGVLPAGSDMTALHRDREWVLVESAGDKGSGWVYAPLPAERVNITTPPRPPPVAREKLARELPADRGPPKAQPPPVAVPAPTIDKPKPVPLAKKPAPEQQQEVRPASDIAIIARLIAASRASYPGPCACPYDTDRAGRSCGRRSAYSRPGGYEPLCYPKDVTLAMIEKERARLARLPVQ